jgi:ribosome-associated protein
VTKTPRSGKSTSSTTKKAAPARQDTRDAKKRSGKAAGSAARAPRGASKSAGKEGVRAKSLQPTTTSRATPAQLDEARDLALGALDAALDKKALMPVLIDVSSMASYTDFIGIVSGRSDRQVEAIADGVSQFMKSRGRRVIGHEGSGNGRWTLLDYGEIVIHVFYHPIREFYDLESLWIDAPRVKIAIPPDAILTQPDALYGAL